MKTHRAFTSSGRGSGARLQVHHQPDGMYMRASRRRLRSALYWHTAPPRDRIPREVRAQARMPLSASYVRVLASWKHGTETRCRRRARVYTRYVTSIRSGRKLGARSRGERVSAHTPRYSRRSCFLWCLWGLELWGLELWAHSPAMRNIDRY
ncbi:hypothetical protein MRX96_018462 [Rhipicephalus microplus]